MTVAGRSPPSRWSWSRTLGACADGLDGDHGRQSVAQSRSRRQRSDRPQHPCREHHASRASDRRCPSAHRRAVRRGDSEPTGWPILPGTGAARAGWSEAHNRRPPSEQESWHPPGCHARGVPAAVSISRRSPTGCAPAHPSSSAPSGQGRRPPIDRPSRLAVAPPARSASTTVTACPMRCSGRGEASVLRYRHARRPEGVDDRWGAAGRSHQHRPSLRRRAAARAGVHRRTHPHPRRRRPDAGRDRRRGWDDRPRRLRASAPSDAAGMKAVIIVGPASSSTWEYLDEGEQIARQAEAQGMDVRRIFTPRATWKRVKQNIQGANLVVYLGHGNGWPSPMGPFRGESKDGLGLNPCEDDVRHELARPSTTARTSSARTIKLAPKAVVFLHRLCYASGNGESWHGAGVQPGPRHRARQQLRVGLPRRGRRRRVRARLEPEDRPARGARAGPTRRWTRSS